MSSSQVIWVEKYRPKDIESCVLPPRLKDSFSSFVQQRKIPNLLFYGQPGIGKTTVARALCASINHDVLVINGSEESGIDVLRTKIRDFASTVSLKGQRKVVILDEADYLNPQSTQPALRAFIEEFSANCGFILTCNYPNRIIDALHSRCSVIEFKIKKNEKQGVILQLIKSLMNILNAEEVVYKKEPLLHFVLRHFPDHRRTINELQKYVMTYGRVNEGILGDVNEESRFGELFDFMRDKNFAQVERWCLDNLDFDAKAVYRKLYDALRKELNEEFIPDAVLTLGKYQHQSAFAADQFLVILACLTEIMINCEFK